MKKTKLMFLLVFVLLNSCGIQSNTHQSIELTISAAASLMDSLIDIRKNFINENPNINITYNFGGSGILRHQIEQGAPIDMFFSASEKDYMLLKESDFIQTGSSLVKNKLVVITSDQMDLNTFEQFLQSNEKMAIGTPEVVPVGMYAKQTLQQLKQWDKLQERLVYTNSVSQVVTYVEEGVVETGFVYGSDVQNAKNIEVIAEIDPSLHLPIVYYFGTIQNDNKQTIQKKKAVDSFYKYVQKKSSLEIFKHHGFQIKNTEVGE